MIFTASFQTMDKILIDFANAWRTLDSELIIKHLSPDFQYDSQWVFESLDYNGYINYIRGKFKNLKDKGVSIVADIVLDSVTGEKIIRLLQSGDPVIYRIKVRDGLVIKGDLCMF